MVGRKVVPSAGVLEVFAHRIDIGMLFSSLHIKNGTVLGRPCALENGQGSTILAPVETACPALCQTEVLRLAGRVRFIFWCENPDACYANRRKRISTEVFSVRLLMCSSLRCQVA